MTSENKIIFITGTPCVGKTTIASNLVDNLSNDFNTKLIKINDLGCKYLKYMLKSIVNYCLNFVISLG